MAPARGPRVLAAVAACLVAAIASAGEDRPRFVADVERAKGHLFSSRELYALGEARRASLHSSHPVQELGHRIIGPVRKADARLAERVRSLLRQPSRAIDRKVSRQDYDGLITQVYAALDEAVDRVVPREARESRVFAATVVAVLLDSLAEEYEDSVRGGRITQVIEYQDAFGFFRRAQALLRTMPGVPGEVTADLDELARAFPAVAPPATVIPPREVKALARRIAVQIVKSATP